MSRSHCTLIQLCFHPSDLMNQSPFSVVSLLGPRDHQQFVGLSAFCLSELQRVTCLHGAADGAKQLSAPTGSILTASSSSYYLAVGPSLALVAQMLAFRAWKRPPHVRRFLCDGSGAAGSVASKRRCVGGLKGEGVGGAGQRRHNGPRQTLGVRQRPLQSGRRGAALPIV